MPGSGNWAHPRADHRIPANYQRIISGDQFMAADFELVYWGGDQNVTPKLLTVTDSLKWDQPSGLLYVSPYRPALFHASQTIE